MATNKPKPPPHKPFGNLPIGDDLKNARKLTRAEFERLANKYLFMPFQEMSDLLQNKERNPNVPVIELAIMSIYYHAIKDGDEKRLNWVMDRVLGQAVRKIHVVTEMENPNADAPAPVEMTQEEKLDMLELYKKKVIKQIKDARNDVVDVPKVEE